ncbi:hypothetical protein GGI25_005424 [Coemansia spiralis]|uniref:DNA-directed RNA polymerase III subunit n=2 Tax=Coemansia TaxID=4863 RepID=A0A9W8KW49_9FUNG|nr:DNA-directed RNA polymerase III, subunit Rpc31 [Coemansia spiralis]KAJ1988251.1 hypothetical protein EDC05_005391 [Coemansia umbellata]KAJ2619608.1 hypothetical protein GGI26_005715 [Coemansia sp. RSA 1358]KAJ2671607.1 hypothetical protein GGI25_005424 [Coemansia spiralis]
MSTGRGRGRGRGRGWGDGARREMSALQTELIGKSLFNKTEEKSSDFPDHEVTAGRASTEEERHIAELMEQFHEEIKASVFYLHLPPPPRDVERYSDRYFKKRTTYMQHPLKGLRTNIELFPEELQSVLLRKKVKRTRAEVDGNDELLEVLKKAKDDEDDEEEKDKKGSDDEDQDIEGELEEEEEEEENDYMDTYFDNGEEDDIGDIDDDDGGGGDYY